MSKIIKLNHITKIEGHASLTLSIDKGKIKKCELQSVEGSRYFEGLVKGRKFDEASEITSRICGICSTAHTVCSIQSIENALSIKPSEQTVLLRELMMMGERIRSHATHLYFLSLPDYTGYESALAMANKFKKELAIALRLVKTGNNIIRLIAGRDIHPVSAQIGGFLKLPANKGLSELKKELQNCKKDAVFTAKLFSKLKYPSFSRETEYFSLSDKGSYATLYGDLVSKSSKFRKDELHRHLKEYHVVYGTANFVVKEGKAYMVGALSRLNNSYSYLSKNAKKIVESGKIKFPNCSPFMNNFAQAIELVHCIDRAIEICSSLKIKEEDAVQGTPKRSYGIGAIEVPRGVLWHEYTLDDDGKITLANIITPTSQNLRNMNEDIKSFLPSILSLKKEKMILEIEKLIRSYDPCFSCSTHFLKVNFDIKR